MILKLSTLFFPLHFVLHTDCMHVASEPGEYVFKKVPHLVVNTKETTLVEAAVQEPTSEVCGLYVIGEPDTIVEITMKHYDVNCETGGLMAVSEKSNLKKVK